ncbi:MAG: FumA C-terminus/TtdB family hydratase beta subunit [Candidatus Omnitrophota bacterium]|nr:FumA C-terminus/TtdB family hydratase beta subunit [Candidatus Omnitrophota bacterium]
MKKLFLPLSKDIIKELKAGDKVELWGSLYTLRDRAHQKLTEAIKKRKKMPFSLVNKAIYYTGPTPALPGRAIGSCGPTTSSRMDVFTPLLLKKGVKALIGKGNRSLAVIDALKKYQGVYFVTIGGAGAFLARKVHKAGIVAYPELGPEAVYQLQVRGFPAIVAIDSCGRSIFKYNHRKLTPRRCK